MPRHGGVRSGSRATPAKALSTDRLPLESVSVSAQPLVRDVILGDGSTLRFRAPTPQDYEDIKAFYDRLSRESLYMRFHGMVGTDVPARHLG